MYSWTFFLKLCCSATGLFVMFTGTLLFRVFFRFNYACISLWPYSTWPSKRKYMRDFFSPKKWSKCELLMFLCTCMCTCVRLCFSKTRCAYYMKGKQEQSKTMLILDILFASRKHDNILLCV